MCRKKVERTDLSASFRVGLISSQGTSVQHHDKRRGGNAQKFDLCGVCGGQSVVRFLGYSNAM